MKKLIALAALLAASGCGGSKPPSAPPPPDQVSTAALAHKVAEIEIGVAKVSYEKNSAGGSNHPEIFTIDEMAAIPIETVNWRALPADQLALLRDVASRIAAANSGYQEMFSETDCGLISRDSAAIIAAAHQSARGDPSQGPDTLVQPDLAAALALQEIEDSPIIQGFKPQISCKQH